MWIVAPSNQQQLGLKYKFKMGTSCRGIWPEIFQINAKIECVIIVTPQRKRMPNTSWFWLCHD